MMASSPKMKEFSPPPRRRMKKRGNRRGGRDENNDGSVNKNAALADKTNNATAAAVTTNNKVIEGKKISVIAGSAPWLAKNKKSSSLAVMAFNDHEIRRDDNDANKKSRRNGSNKAGSNSNHEQDKLKRRRSKERKLSRPNKSDRMIDFIEEEERENNHRVVNVGANSRGGSGKGTSRGSSNTTERDSKRESAMRKDGFPLEITLVNKDDGDDGGMGNNAKVMAAADGDTTLASKSTENGMIPSQIVVAKKKNVPPAEDDNNEGGTTDGAVVRAKARVVDSSLYNKEGVPSEITTAKKEKCDARNDHGRGQHKGRGTDDSIANKDVMNTTALCYTPPPESNNGSARGVAVGRKRSDSGVDAAASHASNTPHHVNTPMPTSSTTSFTKNQRESSINNSSKRSGSVDGDIAASNARNTPIANTPMPTTATTTSSKKRKSNNSDKVVFDVVKASSVPTSSSSMKNKRGMEYSPKEIVNIDALSTLKCAFQTNNQQPSSTQNSEKKQQHYYFGTNDSTINEQQREHFREVDNVAKGRNLACSNDDAYPPSINWMEQMTFQIATTTRQQFEQQAQYYESKLQEQGLEQQRAMEVMQQKYNEQCRENERLQKELNVEKEKNGEKDVKFDKMESDVDLLRLELQKAAEDE